MSDYSRIFINEDFRSKLEEQSENLSTSLTIYSAFVKQSALKWLAEFIPKDAEVKIIARWQPNDLIANASDLESYHFCKERDWRFGIQNTLHSKVFIFDDSKVLLGSANLTDLGLSISKEGNLEVGTLIDASIKDLARLKRLEEGVVWLNKEIFDEINSHIEEIKIHKPKVLSWTKSLKNKLEKPIEFLWINELLWANPFDLLNPDFDIDDHAHDFDLLGLELGYLSDEVLSQKFINTNIYKFLIQELQKAQKPHTNFGWVTQILHNAILDNPPPNRVSVKHYVEVLFEWLKFSKHTNINLIKYERTTSLELKI